MIYIAGMFEFLFTRDFIRRANARQQKEQAYLCALHEENERARKEREEAREKAEYDAKLLQRLIQAGCHVLPGETYQQYKDRQERERSDFVSRREQHSALYQSLSDLKIEYYSLYNKSTELFSSIVDLEIERDEKLVILDDLESALHDLEKAFAQIPAGDPAAPKMNFDLQSAKFDFKRKQSELFELNQKICKLEVEKASYSPDCLIPKLLPYGFKPEQGISVEDFIQQLIDDWHTQYEAMDAEYSALDAEFNRSLLAYNLD